MSVIELSILLLACLITVQLIRANELPFLHPGCDEYEDPTEPTQLPHPTDCNKFYKCAGGYAFTLNCPKGLHFAVESDRCEYPGEAHCSLGTTKAQKTTTTQKTPTTQKTSTTTAITNDGDFGFVAVSCPVGENPKEIIHLPYPGDCTKFFKCKTGNVYPLSCPPGLHWSVALTRCELPGVAKCARKSASTTTNASGTTKAPTPAPTLAPPPTPARTPSSTKLPSTKPTLDPTIEPAPAQTPAQTPAPTPPPTSATPNIDFMCKNISSAFLSYPGNCRRYIQCLNGSGLIRSCPGNLYYNSKIGVCSRVCA